MSSSKVTLALIQMRCSAEPRENPRQVLVATDWRSGGPRRAESSAFQELFTSQYFCQVEDHKYFQLAEEIPGPSTETLGKLARERGVVIVASLFEKRSAGLYHNTAAVIDADGAYLGKYRKMHIPDDLLDYEVLFHTRRPRFRARGRRAYAKIGGGRSLGSMADAESGALLTALAGAQLLLPQTATWLVT